MTLSNSEATCIALAAFPYTDLMLTPESMKVKNDHCGKFSNLSNQKEEA